MTKRKKSISIKDRIYEKLSSVKTWALIAGFITLIVLKVAGDISGESLASKITILIPAYFAVNLGQKIVYNRK